jgi:hypothetical protein
MKGRTMSMSALLTAFATFLMCLGATHAEDGAATPPSNDATSEAVEFRKFCETAASSGTLFEKEKFLAWCEAEAKRIATSPPSQTQTQPPGPETGIPSPAATSDAVGKGWRELTRRFGTPKPTHPAATPTPDGAIPTPE